MRNLWNRLFDYIAGDMTGAGSATVLFLAYVAFVATMMFLYASR